MRSRHAVVLSVAVLAAMLAASQPVVAESLCFPRTLGRTHAASLVFSPEEMAGDAGGAADEMGVQRRCLAWEYEVWPKAELAASRRLAVVIAGLPVAETRSPRKAPLSDPFSREPCEIRDIFAGLKLLAPSAR